MQNWSFQLEFLPLIHVSQDHTCAGGGYKNAFGLQFSVGETASRFRSTW